MNDYIIPYFKRYVTMLGCIAEATAGEELLMRFDAEQRWKQFWEAQGVPSAKALLAYGRLMVAYGGSNRLYHNMGHIRHCLNVYDTVRNLALHPDEVEAAIWFHDVCYDARSSANEEDSVAWARRVMKDFGMTDAFMGRVASLIMATKKHDGQLTDPDEQLIADIDLSSLGLDWDLFWLNTKDIEREYSHLDRRQFAAGRAEILKDFLYRPFIYYRPELSGRYGDQARANLSRSITLLHERATA